MQNRDVPGRLVRNIDDVSMQKDVFGETSDRISWYPLTFDENGNQKGCYLYKMEPNSSSDFHVHKNNEDYLIIEGELVESDGTILKAGDFVHYDAGTEHNSHSVSGCLILVAEW